MVFKPKESVRTKLKLSQLATWQLVLVLAIWAVVVASLLRVNNVQMIQRREAVKVADEKGDDTALKDAAIVLQKYSAKHMNSSTGPIDLKQKYLRDIQLAVEKAQSQALHNPHGNVYKRAADVCDPHYTLYSHPYFNCILQEVDKYAPSSQVGELEIKYPDPAPYKLEFISPRFSFDWAGLSVVVFLGLVAIIAIRLFFSFLFLIVVKIKEKQD